MHFTAKLYYLILFEMVVSVCFCMYIAKTNEYITGSFIQYTNRSVIECCLKCAADSGCLATNYADGTGTCELLTVHPSEPGVVTVHATGWTLNYYTEDLCEDNWLYYKTNCYKIQPRRLTWNDSLAKCKTYQADLTDIQDDAENEFLNIAAENVGVLKFFIGLTDVETEGIWIWTSGAPFLYHNFSPEEQNNRFGIEHCVVSGEYRTWLDVNCSLKRSSICKKPILS